MTATTFRAAAVSTAAAAESRNERGRRSRSPRAGGGHGGRGARGGGRTIGSRHDCTRRVVPYLSTVTPGTPSETPWSTRHACAAKGAWMEKGCKGQGGDGDGGGRGGGAPHLRSLAPASLDEPGRLAAPRRGHGAVREAERGRPGRGERAHRGTPPPARAGSERRVVTREKNAIDPRRRRRRRKQWTATTLRAASGEQRKNARRGSNLIFRRGRAARARLAGRARWTTRAPLSRG